MRFEAALARLGLLLIPLLSRRSILKLASILGTIAFLVSPHLRRVGRANLDLALAGSASDDDKRRILRASFRSFALTILDTFWFSRDTASRIDRYVKFAPGGERVLVERPQICITAHLGNWEVLGMTMSHRGFPLLSVAAPLSNPDVDTLFNRLRVVSGQRVMSKHGVVRALLKTLKDGGKIALVLDQNTKPSEGGIFIDFFGLPVPVASAAAGLSIKTGAEVLVGGCLPQPDGTYLVPEPQPIPMPPVGGDDTISTRTRAITEAIEQWVRRYPQCWLWTYKRWKYVAPWRKREEYPFYAKELSEADKAALNAYDS